MPEHFLFHRPEADLLAKTAEGQTLTVYRPVDRDGGQRTLDAATIAALKIVGKWKVGKRFWTKEHFILKFDADAGETEIRFYADRQLIPPGVIRGQVGDLPKNGVYSPLLMRMWMARCRVEIVGLEIEYGSYYRTNQISLKVDWVWALQLKRIALR